MAPWIRDYVVAMPELYCELVLEEVVCKPFGLEYTLIKNYQSLFENAPVPVKILTKGDPGIGKTTLAKKIAWDWAKKKFNNVSIVLLVYLKFVHPDDSLENAMIERIPELEGLRVSPSKLESFIEHFGERCLLILDGLDEHAYGSNKDVQKVLQRRKYLNCNILVTSRPHSIAEIRGCCQIVVSVEGFTRSEAKKFAFAIVRDEKAVEQILDFNPTGGKQEVVLHKCPILLSFMCILVKDEDAIDLTKKNMPTGEIYTKMIQCLYKKFTIRRGIRYKDVEFTKVVRLVGKLAWEILLSGNALFERSRVEREIGKDAFDYGFLIGNEKLIGDLKADILITFAHRSIQEFFGAFGFVLLLNNRKIRLDDPTSTKTLFLDNPLFIDFCLWFLSDRCRRKYFPDVDMKTACSELYTYVHKKIQSRVLNFGPIVAEYPALNILLDEINAEHLERILEMLDNVQCVRRRYDDPIDRILNHIKSTLALIVVDDDSQESQHNLFPEFLQSKGKNLNIVLSGKACSPTVIKCLLERAALWERHPIVCLLLMEGQMVDISEVLHQEMRELYVIGTSRAQTKVIASSDLVPCPFLTHLSITGDVVLDESVTLAIGKVAREGGLSKLKSVNFACSELTGPIGHLFDGEKILLTVTNLSFYNVGGNDIESLSQNWINVTSLSLNTLTKSSFRRIMWSLRRDILPNLKKLCLSVIDTETIGLEALEAVKPQNLPELEHLGLERCISSRDVLKQLSHLATNGRLHTLDISHSRGIKGKLSILLQYKFPLLKSLNLHDCELNKEDLVTLDDACIQRKLPMLKDLDLSENCLLIADLDLMKSKWKKLRRLNLDHQESSHVEVGLQFLGTLIRRDCIPSIQELRLAIHATYWVGNKTVFPKKLQYLERLDIVTSTGYDIVQICEHVHDLKKLHYFPALKTVCVLSDNVTIDGVNSCLLKYRKVGLELNLVKRGLEKLAIDSGLIKDRT